MASDETKSHIIQQLFSIKRQAIFERSALLITLQYTGRTEVYRQTDINFKVHTQPQLHEHVPNLFMYLPFP